MAEELMTFTIHGDAAKTYEFGSVADLSKFAAEHFAAGEFREAALLHARAREHIESAFAEKTVLQLDDGQLATVLKSDLEGKTVEQVHAELREQLKSLG
jgi:hypothetical protein